VAIAAVSALLVAGAWLAWPHGVQRAGLWTLDSVPRDSPSPSPEPPASPSPVPSPSPSPAANTFLPKSGVVGRIVIPSINVDAQIESLAVDKDGAMDVPTSLWTTGWYNRGPWPGEQGDAVLDGHLGVVANGAVFANLRNVKPGDEVVIMRSDGYISKFKIESMKSYPYSARPDGLFSPAGPARLSIITCNGQWDFAHNTYFERLIVEASPVT
jgi:sortase (surface protein transpeptidase)